MHVMKNADPNSKQVVLASSNKGKIVELQGALEPFGYHVVSQTSFSYSDAIEDALSFVENAIKKARHASQQTGLPAIADDSGLEVEALNGAPASILHVMLESTAMTRPTMQNCLNVCKTKPIELPISAVHLRWLITLMTLFQ